jgi:6-phosphogluconate dehydrogenase
MLGLDHQQLHEIFAEWNTTDELNSYLIEITADIFTYIDPDINQPLVDKISMRLGKKVRDVGLFRVRWSWGSLFRL